MNRPLFALTLLVVVASCGTDGATKFGEGTPDPVEMFGDCAFCHGDVAAEMIATGGHGNPRFRCQFCHPDELTPGDVGPGHRSIRPCSDCHEGQETHHDPAAGTVRECAVCHDPHGSTNLFLVDEVIRTPFGTSQEIEFTNLMGVADGGFVSATDPGSGLCEVCHTETEFFRTDGTGRDHFTFPCLTCHPHSLGFSPES